MNEQIRKSRELLQNPYAHLDGDGKFTAAEPSTQGGSAARRHSDREIEEASRQIQITLWQRRHIIWPDRPDMRPQDVLDPVEALRTLGFVHEYDDSLGRMKIAGKSTEVAGILDRNRKNVRVSREFPVATRNFTTAHELGHVALGHQGNGLHRDRPGNSERRMKQWRLGWRSLIWWPN